MLFGGLTVFLRNELFIKWKPSIANWAFAAAFLWSHRFAQQPLIQTALGKVVNLKPKDWLSLSWFWIIFFTLVGIANLYVAYTYDTEFWVKFKVIGLMGATLVFSVLQGIWLMKKGEFIEDSDDTDDTAIEQKTTTSDINQANTTPTDAPRIERIRQILSNHFPDANIDLQDESHLHAGHAGAEDGRGHFRLDIVSKELTGLSAVKKHQLIYAALGDLMQTDIHALAIHASSPDEIF